MPDITVDIFFKEDKPMPSKACGTDMIPVQVLRDMAEEIYWVLQKRRQIQCIKLPTCVTNKPLLLTPRTCYHQQRLEPSGTSQDFDRLSARL